MGLVRGVMDARDAQIVLYGRSYRECNLALRWQFVEHPIVVVPNGIFPAMQVSSLANTVPDPQGVAATAAIRNPS